MQKVGGQGAAWQWGKERGSGGTPAAIFDKFVRSKDVAGRGQREGGQWGQVECTAADKYFIHFHNFNKIEEIYSRRRRRQATKQQPSRQKESRREEGEAEAGKTNQKRKKRWKIGKWKTQKCAACNEGPPKAGLKGTVEQQR